jgi:hypothetical protein
MFISDQIKSISGTMTRKNKNGHNIGGPFDKTPKIMQRPQATE